MKKNKSLLKRIQNSKTYNVIAIICMAWSFITIISVFAVYANWVPGYKVDLYRSDSLFPTISLFPGQQIRLKFDYQDPTYTSNINSATWYISKGDSTPLEIEGLQPTIKLPLISEGIYKLAVKAITNDNTIKWGKTNLYVVQDKPKIIKLSKPLNIIVNENNIGGNLKNAINNKGVEIYTGDNNWMQIRSLKSKDNTFTLGLEPNQNIPTYNNQILLRAQDSKQNINSYGFVPIK